MLSPGADALKPGDPTHLAKKMAIAPPAVRARGTCQRYVSAAVYFRGAAPRCSRRLSVWSCLFCELVRCLTWPVPNVRGDHHVWFRRCPSTSRSARSNSPSTSHTPTLLASISTNRTHSRLRSKTKIMRMRMHRRRHTHRRKHTHKRRHTHRRRHTHMHRHSKCTRSSKHSKCMPTFRCVHFVLLATLVHACMCVGSCCAWSGYYINDAFLWF